MIDNHNHCRFSFDCNVHENAMIEEAIKRGIKVLTFSDHVEFGEMPFDVPEIDYDLYFKELNIAKEKYKNDIEILLGVEIGMMPGLFDKYNEFLSKHPFDCVIMSTHDIQGEGRVFSKLREGILTEEEVIDMYYKQMLDSMQYNNFDTLAHLDFFDRYFPDKSKLPPFSHYSNYIEKIMKILVSKGKALEFNRAGRRNNLNYNHPKKEALEVYKDCGGKLMTFGSDSHTPSSLGSDFKECVETCRYYGLDLIYYKERKPIKYSI